MNIGILLYEKVEELDFIGPLEVFLKANSFLNKDLETNRILRISKDHENVVCANGTTVKPDYSYDDAPSLDILVVPGGQGSRKERYNPSTKGFILKSYPRLKYLLSVCTGSLILAEIDLLNGKKATTHHEAIDLLKQYPEVTVVENVRFTRDGNIVTSAGITAGIDASLYLLEQLYPQKGEEISTRVRRRLEYE